MRDNLPEKFRRILVIRLDNIGDVVMLTPALRAIHKAYPEAEITLLASPAGSQVVSLIPWVDRVVTWRPSWQDISGAISQDRNYELTLVKQIQEGGYDLALIFTSFSQSPYPPAYACYLAGVPWRAGQSKEFGGSILTHWGKPPADSGHQVDRNLALLELLRIPTDGTRMELVVNPDARISAQNLLREAGVLSGEPYVILAPGASCSARRYPVQRFAEAAELLRSTIQLPLVVIGSQPEQKPLEPITRLAKKGEIYSLVGQTSIPELAAVIAGASLVIANNSASLHFADCFGVPMVVLYSGTEYLTQWEPRFSPSIILRRDTSCSPCYRFSCPYQLECLDISPEEVCKQAVQLIASLA